MCNPMLAVMAVTTVMSVAGSVAQTKQQNQMAEAQGEAANAAARFDYEQLAQQGMEANEAAAQDKLQRKLQTQRELGTIMVAQGEAGVGGKSALRVMGNAMMQGSYDVSVIEANRLSKARQTIASAEGVRAKAEGRINEARAMTSDGRLSAVMAGVSGAASGYSMSSSLFSGSTMSTSGNVDFGSSDPYTANRGIR
ncbi:hypothetical protein KAR91_73380 [Candidatus Pacearchaeota archaeon]|nr:hypothetical protein [Candidatus Pacearchaeota archaeon]